MADSLLVELLTEELPPKALAALGGAFANGIRDELVALGLAPKGGNYEQDLATPRRLAVLVRDVAARAASAEKEVSGPSASAPPAAVAGFAKKHGVAVEALERKPGAKGEVWVARVKAGGTVLDDALAGVVERAVKKLPIPKLMTYQRDICRRSVRLGHALSRGSLHFSAISRGMMKDVPSRLPVSGDR